MINDDLIARLGAAFSALKPLCKNTKDIQLLSDELFKLRGSIWALLHEAKDL